MLANALHEVLQRIDNAARGAGRPSPRLLAVSKQHPATAIAALAEAGQRAFGENYVQEARRKRAALEGLAIEWHLIGHLQSNKAADAAALFDWVQTVDRLKLVDALSRHRPPTHANMNVLIQVNVDDEAGKHGCRPGDVPALAAAVAASPRLSLRGLMAIPTPHARPELRRPAFRRMKILFDALAVDHPGVDTLSIGMSDDYPIAIEEGATMVRIGTALFGARGP